MKIMTILGAMGIAAIIPGPLSGQVGLGARGGTLGIGPEISLAVGDHVGLRGGIGFVPVDFTGTFSGIEYTLEPPSAIWNVGVDIYPGLGGLRLSAGLLNRPRYDLSGDHSGSTRVGNQVYTGTIHFMGSVSNQNETAPYLAIGFGRTTQPGFGMFIDIGAAFVGDANIELSGTCTLSSGSPCPAGFEDDIEEEEAQAEDDVNQFLKLHPILQIGVRIGLGR